jgi:hypothetical protein
MKGEIPPAGIARPEVGWRGKIGLVGSVTAAPLGTFGEEPAETSGLLAGIAGVLKPAPAVRALPAVPVRQACRPEAAGRAKLWHN